MYSKLYYIASNHPTKSHSELVEKACRSGIKLIQLRMKNFSLEEVISEANKCSDICKKHNSTLVINDFIDIAKEIDCDGVHLGKSDKTILEARKILGDNTVIGGTANSYEDVINLINAKVDYIGLGPFKYTETKKVLSPILGLKGYKIIIEKLQKEKIDFPPIYAIGGIELDDISELMKTGIYGIAVSGLLTNNFSLVEEIEKELKNSEGKEVIELKKKTNAKNKYI